MANLYCSIYNGLGNQLFGYALGLHIAKKYDKKLYIDLTKMNLVNFLSSLGIKKDTRRKYELDKLGFTDPTKKFTIFEVLKKFKTSKKDKYIIGDFRKSHKNFESINVNQDIYTIGWGDFNIVKKILPEMRTRFTPNFKITSQFSEAKNIIIESNSVAIHIRRTDFLNPKLSGNFWGVCTYEYYNNAIQSIKEKVKNPVFIIFSDDIEYVRENMNFENSHVVEGNTGYEDLYLMSLCKHFILANSTFGFWAAILNNEKNKTVCVPEYWYNSPLRMADYIPEEWERIAIK